MLNFFFTTNRKYKNPRKIKQQDKIAIKSQLKDPVRLNSSENMKERMRYCSALMFIVVKLIIRIDINSSVENKINPTLNTFKYLSIMTRSSF